MKQELEECEGRLRPQGPWFATLRWNVPFERWCQKVLWLKGKKIQNERPGSREGSFIYPEPICPAFQIQDSCSYTSLYADYKHTVSLRSVSEYEMLAYEFLVVTVTVRVMRD